MDQKKNQGQQSDRSEGQQRQGEERSHGQGPQTRKDDQHDTTSSTSQNREKGRGGQGERNLGGGISNRDMDRDLLEEQDEMADRDRQSER